MPVLIVSEKTWPQEGFSRKRSTRPSSSVTTIPNSSGFSTDFKPIVTAASRSRWKSTSAVRSRSEEHTSELQSHSDLVCRLLLEKKKTDYKNKNDATERSVEAIDALTEQQVER